jgi:hypothetical protein
MHSYYLPHNRQGAANGAISTHGRSDGRTRDNRSFAMTVTMTPFLRNIFAADAAVSGAAAILMIVGAPYLAPFLGLPSGLLFWAGVALVPFLALLLVTLRRQSAPRLILIDIIGINALWVAASFGLLFSGLVSPNMLGIAFVAAQALAVAVLAELQFVGMRRATSAAASA